VLDSKSIEKAYKMGYEYAKKEEKKIVKAIL
jgi:hypothetical protein